jgi:ribonuclease P protein component
MPVPFDNASEGGPSSERGGVRARTGEHFPRAARLLRRGDFVRVQERGRRVHTPHFVILLLLSASQRLGVTVGRRVGGAVRRNRVKRLIREVYRRNRELFPSDCDVVLVARPGSDGLDYASVHAELVRAQAALARARRQLEASDPKPAPEP